VNIEDFHSFLKFRGTSETTIRDYLAVLRKLRKEKLVNTTKYTVITCRLLIQFLYYFHGVDLREYFSFLKVPKSGIDLFVPAEEQVLSTLEKTKEREDIYMIYLVLLASGARLSEAVIFLKSLNKQKFIEIDSRAVKYPFPLLRGRKKVFYIYLPKVIAEFLERIELTRDIVSSYAKRHNLVKPKYIRKFVAQQMFKLGIDPVVIDFIQGRVARSVLARHYLNLSYLADKQYSKYAKWLMDVRLSL